MIRKERGHQSGGAAGLLKVKSRIAEKGWNLAGKQGPDEAR